MSLLDPNRRLASQNAPPAFRVIRCPMIGHQVSWCRGLCRPFEDGRGLCGRQAPHLMRDRTQAAIASYLGRGPESDEKAPRG